VFIQRKANEGFDFLDGLFKNTLKIITDEDFLREARGASLFSFSRKRKLSVKELVLLLLGFSRFGVRHELDKLFKCLSYSKNGIQTYSNSAFTQYRQKLQVASLSYLLTKLLEYFEQHAVHKKLWHGFRLIAIDGSSLNLPEESRLREYFGSSKNQTGTESTTARISIAYDVTNKLVLDAQISDMKTGEQTLAKAHIANLSADKDLLIFDRGYPSISFACSLHQQGFKFCFRLSTAWKEAYKLLKNANDIDWILPKGKRYWEDRKEVYLKETVEGFRLVKIQISKKECIVLLTNLSDREKFPIELLQELYKMRWTIEECYKRIKQVAQLEFFSGKTPIAIQQDFYSRIIMLNLSSMIETQELQPQIDISSPSKYKKQVNRTQVMLKLKEFSYDLFWKENPEIELQKMLVLLYKCKDDVKPNRSFKRKKSFKYKRKPLQYKA
jgi:hypothetical protein